MATDSTEPRVGLIAKVGVFAVVVLFATRAALGAYFDHEVQLEEQAKIGSAKPEALMNLRSSESQRLSAGAMPIDKAMAQLATRGRLGAGPDLVPSASRDVAPLQGWSKMPGEAPPGMLAPPPSAQAADAGADAGVAHGADAGAKKKNP
jgi:hypothetical protein